MDGADEVAVPNHKALKITSGTHDVKIFARNAAHTKSYYQATCARIQELEVILSYKLKSVNSNAYPGSQGDPFDISRALGQLPEDMASEIMVSGKRVW